MTPAWEVLCRWGLPLGAARPHPGGPFDRKAVAAALAEVVAGIDEVGEPEKDALAAWIAALGHHWPEQFAAVAGGEGAAIAARAERLVSDPNRRLKLRRIAIENLSRVV